MLLVCPASEVSPIAVVYHRYCPAVPPVADKVTEVDGQPVAAIAVGAVGTLFICAITLVRVLSQPLLILTK